MEDSLPSDLLRSALEATSTRPAGMSERAAAGTGSASRFAAWASLAAVVAVFCLTSWLIVRPSIDAGPQQASVATSASAPPERSSQRSSASPIDDTATEMRLVPLSPELRRELRRFADDPAGSRQNLTALLPGLADRARDIALSDRLLAIVKSDGAASIIRAERSGPALRLRLPEEAQ